MNSAALWRRIRIFGTIFVSMLLGMPVHAVIKVACVGDSITWGQGAREEGHPEAAYPAVLQSLLGSGYEVQNFGASGSTLLSRGSLGQGSGDAYINREQFIPSKNFNADIIIIMLGTNDGHNQLVNQTAGLSLWDQDYDNLIAQYKAGRAVPPQFLLATAAWPPSSAFVSQDIIGNMINPKIRDYAARNGYPLVDIWNVTYGTPFNGNSNTHLATDWWYDPVHPYIYGYQQIANAFHAAVTNQTPPAQVAILNVKGNGISIAHGSTSTSSAKGSDFGQLAVTAESKDQVFTIHNTGKLTATLTGSPAVAITGPQASDFTVISQPGSSIGTNQSVSFTIRFDPLSTGLRQAAVSILSNDSARSPYTFTITGYALVSNFTACNYGSTWRWSIPVNDPGTSWRANGFDDSTWSPGPGIFGFETATLPSPGIQTAVGSASTPPITYLFRRIFNYNGPTSGATVVIDQIVDDGVAYYLNGNLIGAKRYTPGGAWNAIANASVGDAAEELGAVSGPAIGLVNGTNVLSAEVHQVAANGSDMVFGARIKIAVAAVDSNEWRQSSFGSPSNSGNGADLADPDLDGLVNMLEFALTQDPKTPASSWGIIAVEGANLTLTYSRRNSAVSELTLTCLWANEVTGPWSSTGISEQILADDGLSKTVKAYVALAGSAKKFMKIQATRP